MHYNNSEAWNKDIENSGAAQIFNFNKKITGRFFGIKVIRSSMKNDRILRLDELGVYGNIIGGEKNHNLLYGLTSDYIKAYYTNIDNGYRTMLKRFPQNHFYFASFLTDGNNGSKDAFGFWGAKESLETLDIVIRLKRPAYIAGITCFSAPGAKDFSPQLMRFYVSDTENGLFAAPARAILTNEDNINGKYQAEFSTVLCSYIRISIEKGGKIPMDSMYALISEIEVYGIFS